MLLIRCNRFGWTVKFTCLFLSLRRQSPQILNLHSSCQIRWQLVVLLLGFFPPTSPEVPGMEKKQPPPSLDFAASVDRTREIGRLHKRGNRPKQTELLDCVSYDRTASPALQCFNSHRQSSRKLTRDTVLICWRQKKKKKQDKKNKVNKVYKAILTGNTRDS